MEPVAPHPPTTLADLAANAGYLAADLAALTGLNKATLSRLWDNPDWAERANGATIQALIAALPGVAEHITRSATTNRLNTLTTQLGRHGLTINTPLGGDSPEQFAYAALGVAVHIMDGDGHNAANHLARFWGRTQDQALHRLFTAKGHDRYLADPTPLIEAARSLADDLESRPDCDSFTTWMARTTLAHHTARTTGASLPVAARNAKQAAFSERSTRIGLILSTGDHDLVDAYARITARSPVAGTVDQWAMATYNRDAQPGFDLHLPSKTVLARTAGAVLDELADYNDAYCHYLSAVYLPAALDRDPTFGGRLPDLAVALRNRLEWLTNPDTRRHVERVLNRLPVGVSPP